ncbi:MAG: ABC transporter substrate-binding protein [Deltaproteobacteria bacterium]|jgi:ABC-type nitrate/sulfonate/bicarbonate transport system substrate-binding protein|nr:ABC transporter substrate-binding protein [Deltaproteobacteria bacterium]MBT4527891.1 ABC transporter substrate-binding protein [Deltaproteobacteria bacterium]
MKNQSTGPSQTKFSKNRLFMGGAILVASVTLISIIFFNSVNNSDKFKEANIKVTLGISKSFLSIPVYIAKSKGFFSEEGIDINIKEFSSGKLATNSMFSGDVDISTAADIPIVFNSFKRSDFCIFATFTSSYSFVSILTREDTGIKKGIDLKGRKIGFNRGTSSHFYLAEFLADHQLLLTDVELIHFKTADLPKALKNKTVDAISVWQPHTHKAEHLPSVKIIKFPSSEIYRTTFNFAVKNSYAQNHKVVLERFTKALIKASKFIQMDKKTAQELVTESLKIDNETVSALWDGYSFQISLDQALLVSWDNIGRWSIDNNFTDKKMIPNYLNYIYLDALDTVKPDSITIIR